MEFKEPKSEILEISDEETSQLFQALVTELPEEKLEKRRKRVKTVKTFIKEEILDEDTTGDCQCYYCGEMVLKCEIQTHMKSSHGRFHRSS